MIERGEMTRWAGHVDAWAARQVLSGKPMPSAEALRDMADDVSYGDLDCIQLDILCDMIDRRIGRWLKA
ncbi:MAG TPA: hypothetical protein VGD41_14215 [Pyrinomonadaceae bacterium]